MFLGCSPCCGDDCPISGTAVSAHLAGSFSVLVPAHPIYLIDGVFEIPEYSATTEFSVTFDDANNRVLVSGETQQTPRPEFFIFGPGHPRAYEDTVLTLELTLFEALGDQPSDRSFLCLAESGIKIWDSFFYHRPCRTAQPAIEEQFLFQGRHLRSSPLGDRPITTSLQLTLGETFSASSPPYSSLDNGVLGIPARDFDTEPLPMQIVSEHTTDQGEDIGEEVSFGNYDGTSTLTITEYTLVLDDGSTVPGFPWAFSELDFA